MYSRAKEIEGLENSNAHTETKQVQNVCLKKITNRHYSILVKGCHAKDKKKKKPSVIKFSYFAAGGGVVGPLREAGNLCFYVKFPM